MPPSFGRPVVFGPMFVHRIPVPQAAEGRPFLKALFQHAMALEQSTITLEARASARLKSDLPERSTGPRPSGPKNPYGHWGASVSTGSTERHDAVTAQSLVNLPMGPPKKRRQSRGAGVFSPSDQSGIGTQPFAKRGPNF